MLAHPHSFRAAVIAAAVLIAAVSGLAKLQRHAPAPVLLQHKLAPGELLEYRTVHTVTFARTHNRETIESVEFLLGLGPGADPGTLTFAVVPGGMMTRDVSTPFRYDFPFRGETMSLAEQPQPGRSAYATALTYTIAPSGRVTTSLFAGLSIRHAGMFLTYGERLQGEADLAFLPLLEFPDEPVVPGAAWTPTGRMVVPTYVFKGIAQVEGRLCVEISASQKAGRTLEGTLWISPEDGTVFREKWTLEGPGPNGATSREELESWVVRRASLSAADLAAASSLLRETEARIKAAPGGRALTGSQPSRPDGRALVGTPLTQAVLRDERGAVTQTSAFRNRVLLVTVGLPYLPAFAQMVGDLALVHRQFEGEGLAVLGVLPLHSADRSLGMTASLKAWLNPPFPVLAIDRQGMAAGSWADGVPMTLLVDKSGVIRRAWPGYRHRSELAPAVAELLSQESTR